MAGIKSLGFTAATPIQEQAIPQILAGEDLLGIAQTGTGKTAAFAIPILQRLATGPTRRVRALIIAPTRELAEQIRQAHVDLSRNMKVGSVAIYGGVGKRGQVTALRRGAEIVVACPGRLLDLLQGGLINLSTVEMLVLDEADRMCDMGFMPDIKKILAHLPHQRQTLFFSATMPRDIRRLAATMLRDPKTVQIGQSAPAQTVSHALYPVPQQSKGRLLRAMLSEKPAGRVLVFTRTKHRARKLATDLEASGHRVAALQGNMTQGKRQKAIQGFRDGRYDILCATDIAARGIDVQGVEWVINFDMPDCVDAYTHRIGRTGRALQSGEAFTFTAPEDASMVRAIERLLGSQIERRQVQGFDYGEFSAPSEQRRPQQRRPQQRRRSGQHSRPGNHRSSRQHNQRSQSR